MPANRLMGSGPSPSGLGMDGGPSPGLSGTLGNAPQAAPQQTPGPGNMLSAGPQPAPGGMPQAQAPLIPPSLEKLQDVYHKQAFTVVALRRLLGTADLKTKDILNEVGEAVAAGVMGPFDAASQLKTLPPADDSLSLRKWVAAHYTTASQALQTVSEMIAAHGHMTRRNAMAPQMQPSFAPQNALTG